MSEVKNLAGETVDEYPIDHLEHHPKNPRKGNIDKIMQSIEQNGFYSALVVQKSTGHVLVGNHRLKAARALGMTHVPVRIVDVNDHDALDIMLVDNKTSDDAEMDTAALEEILTAIAVRDGEEGLLGTGYGLDELADIVAENDAESPEMLEAAAEKYSQALPTPTYTPHGFKPDIKALMNTAKSEALIEEIMDSGVDDAEKEYLIEAARRHTVFSYEDAAEYYCHASAEMQDLMEKSALVIIDIKKAMEYGFVEFHEAISSLFKEDYPDA